MIKVCFVITGLFVGGAEMMLYKLLQHNPRLRQSLVITLIPGGEMASRIQMLGVRVESLNMQRRSLNILSVWHLWRLLRTEKFELVSTWMYHAEENYVILEPDGLVKNAMSEA